jgi:hypothetical protein
VTTAILDDSTPAVPRRVSPGVRRFWLVAGSIVTVALLLFGAFNIVNGLAHEVMVANYSFPAEDVRALRVDVDRGAVHVVASDDSQVHVHARISRGLHDSSHDVHLAGHTLVADASCPHFQDLFCSVDYTIRVPASVSTSASSAKASVDVDGIAGPVRITSVDGDVTGRRLTSTTATATSVDGDATLTFAEVPTTVETSSVNGDVVVDVPRGSVFHVDATTENGSVSTGIRTDPASQRSITAHSVNGDVRVGYRRAPSQPAAPR